MDQKVVVYIYTKEHYAHLRKNKIMKSPLTFMELEYIMLSKVGEWERDKELPFIYGT